MENKELANAINVLVEELKKDKSEGSYYYSWQSNIAMSMYDGLNGKITRDEANIGARRFLEILINDVMLPTSKK